MLSVIAEKLECLREWLCKFRIPTGKVCFYTPSEPVESKKSAFSADDFDEGDLEIGDEACNTLTITVDGGTQSVTIAPVAGITFTDLGQVGQTRTIKACWTWAGTIPNPTLVANVVATDGSTATYTGSSDNDFRIGSGGGDTILLEFGQVGTKVELKEYCALDQSPIYQLNGVTVDVSDYTRCPDVDQLSLAKLCEIKAIAEENLATNKALLEKYCEPCPVEFEKIATPNPNGTVTQVVDGDLSSINGTQQTTYDAFGAATGTVNVSAVYNSTTDQTTITMMPTTTTQSVTAIKSLSIKMVSP